MKIRQGFVSNSSSSSFVIKKKYLTKEQIEKIKNHISEAGKEKYDDYDFIFDAWDITETLKKIKGYTYMDNFNMEEFLSEIDVRRKHIEWGD